MIVSRLVFAAASVLLFLSAEARGEGTSVGASEELSSGDQAVSESGARFRAPIWRPRFFGP